MRKIFLSLLSSFLATFLSLSQNVTVSGVAAEYAGTVLSFYAVDNYFINNKKAVGECKIFEDGFFSLSFPCEETITIFTDLGIFNARLVVESGYSYEIKLPPRVDKLPEEEDSPFFEEAKVYMMILSVKDNNGKTVLPDDELNMRIVKYDNFFNPLYDQLAMDAANKCPSGWLDTCVNNFIETLPSTKSAFFNDYAFFSSGLLYYAAQRRDKDYISENFFVNKPVLYDNTAYWDLFNDTYRKYFIDFGSGSSGISDIYRIINSTGSFAELKRLLLSSDFKENLALCELVILKNIHDEFYSDRFSKSALINILDSAIIYSKTEKHAEIATQIRTKITRMLRGFEPPHFSLYNQDSALVSLEKYKEKYVYLMFCSSQSKICLSQYKLLADLYKAHNKWLDIVVISFEDSFSRMRDFRDTSGYLWDFLYFGDDPNLVKQYDVRIFPTSFYIDPAGKLVMSPAPVPAPIYDPEAISIDDLEKTLLQELRAKGLFQEYIRKGLIFEPNLNEQPFPQRRNSSYYQYEQPAKKKKITIFRRR